VIDAVSKAIGADYATVHRGVYTRSAEMTLGYEAARRRVAAFVGGREDEIVFTRGATEAINLVAYSWPDKRRVLLSELEHHSNIVPGSSPAGRSTCARSPTTAGSISTPPNGC
jgi:cysteine desulfurase/selenocysteine lyase